METKCRLHPGWIALSQLLRHTGCVNFICRQCHNARQSRGPAAKRSYVDRVMWFVDHPRVNLYADDLTGNEIPDGHGILDFDYGQYAPYQTVSNQELKRRLKIERRHDRLTTIANKRETPNVGHTATNFADEQLARDTMEVKLSALRRALRSQQQKTS